LLGQIAPPGNDNFGANSEWARLYAARRELAACARPETFDRVRALEIAWQHIVKSEAQSDASA